METWENPLNSLEDRLAICAGAVEFERKVVANLREQLSRYEQAEKGLPVEPLRQISRRLRMHGGTARSRENATGALMGMAADYIDALHACAIQRGAELAAEKKAREKYKKRLDEFDAVIDDEHVAESCINPLEDLKIAIRKLKQRAEAAERRAEENERDAERYRKLRRWMSSNVPEGWSEVEKLAAIACYINWETFDAALDDMPVCNVGLCHVAINTARNVS